MSGVLLLLPFVILLVMVKLFLDPKLPPLPELPPEPGHTDRRPPKATSPLPAN
jgi:hypothetical protein